MTVIHMDETTLAALREVMGEDYPLLLDTFLADSQARLELLQQTGDAEQLSLIAHSLKGSCSNMGALHLAGLCRELEDHAQAMSEPAIGQLLDHITEEMGRVQRLYRAERLTFPG